MLTPLACSVSLAEPSLQDSQLCSFPGLGFLKYRPGFLVLLRLLLRLLTALHFSASHRDYRLTCSRVVVFVLLVRAGHRWTCCWRRSISAATSRKNLGSTFALQQTCPRKSVRLRQWPLPPAKVSQPWWRNVTCPS